SGQVSEWTARLPAMLAVLATTLMVHALARRYVGRRAALFAAASFMFTPMLLQKLTISQPHTPVTALSLRAFVVWWQGVEPGRPAFWRGLACGLLLALAALTKGPPPLMFFALGVGAVTVVQRRWRALPGLIVCLCLPAVAILGWAWGVHQPGD